MEQTDSVLYAVLEHHGVRTMHSFESEEDFKEWYDTSQNGFTVLYKGPSAKRAVELSDCIENNSRFARLITGRTKIIRGNNK